MAWTTPIINRAAADITTALNNPLVATQLIGSLNDTDLNRIEGNVEYLSDALETYLYLSDTDIKTDWSKGDILYQDEAERILNNLQALIDTYYTLSTTPSVPDIGDFLTYASINAIEQVLVDLKYLLELMIEGFKYSGTFYAGQEVAL
jgi:hypothetical protein